MWNIFQALAYILTRFTRSMVDVETQTAGTADVSPTDLHEPREAPTGIIPFLLFTLQLTKPKDAWKLDKEGLLRRSSLRRAAGLTDLIQVPNLNVKLRPAAKSRTRSARYLLRQGEYVENWNSPGCDLSELYGKKTPRSLSPSPLLSGSTASGEHMFRFPSKSPNLPSEMPQSSKNLQSPFLSSTLESTNSPDFSDLAHAIMKDLEPVAYSNNPSSAVACTFWDIPVAFHAPNRSESGSSVSQDYNNPINILGVPFTPSGSMFTFSPDMDAHVFADPAEEICSRTNKGH